MQLTKLTPQQGATLEQSWLAPKREASADGRVSAEAAGYMELDGAQKDGDCSRVNVAGGVSSKLGICREQFEPQEGAREFECGSCQFYKSGATRAAEPSASAAGPRSGGGPVIAATPEAGT
jgi:hypothetical protein